MASATSVEILHPKLQPVTPGAAIDDLSSHQGDIIKGQVEYWITILRQELTALNESEDFNNDHVVDSQVMNAPRRRSSQPTLAAKIAAALFPNLTTENAIRCYETDIKTLRSSVTRQYWATAKQSQPKETWHDRILKQGRWNQDTDPVSLNGPPSLPMPVEVASKDSLLPFFAHLRNGGTDKLHHDSAVAVSTVEPSSNMSMLEFPKGVIYADGRVDLCKKVVGPRSIQDLMDSLRPNTFVKHFLLGNNIVGAVGAKAIASFIDDLPDRMETWYLAGNCINTSSLTLLVDSMVRSTAITNVWLKRNPLKADAASDLARLIMHSQLQVLDLDQTELGDAGVAGLFSILTNSDTAIALKHIYLNACGISSTACEQIASFLASSQCSLESLYMSCNPIGTSVKLLADGIRNNRSLQRLTLQSCGLESQSAIHLLDAVKTHPALMRLDLGQAYATEDLGQRYNWLTDECAPALTALLSQTTLKYLAIDNAPMSKKALNIVLPAVASSSSIEFFSAKSLFNGMHEKNSRESRKEIVLLLDRVTTTLHHNVAAAYGCSYDDFQSKHKRALQSPPGIELIDSVYRNRDAGLARRGLMKLDKLWNDGDESVKRSEDGDVW